MISPWTKTEEWRRKIGDANRGKPKSVEHREKIRKANLGKKLSQETKNRMSIAKMGHVLSEETRKKISLANKGKPHGGGKCSKKTKKLLRKINLEKKPHWIHFYLYTLNGRNLYVGQTKSIKNRHGMHLSGETTFGKNFLKDHPQAICIDLNIKVWDITYGRWANAIEEALIVEYDTRFPKGFNKLKGVPKSKEHAEKLRHCDRSFSKTKAYRAKMSKVNKKAWKKRKAKNG